MKRSVKAAGFLALLFAACICGGCGKDASAVVSPSEIFLTEPIAPSESTVPTVEAEEKNDNRIDTGGDERKDDGALGAEEGSESSDYAESGDMASVENEAAGKETEEIDNIVTITISAAGDVTLGNYLGQDYTRSFVQTYEEQGKAYFFQNVLEYFLDDDMTIVNFEGVLTESEEIQEKDYNMKGEPEYVYILTEGSVEAVSFGNNHRLDYLAQGSRDTVDMFEEAGIAYAYDNITGIYETKGIRIGFVSVNESSQGTAVEKYLKEGIAKLRDEEEADLVIACCHWGIEKDYYPEDYQKELGRKCIDWGADLVLGSHPHVLQGIEVYEGRFIVYSLGNFCFGANRNPSDKDTMIFRQTFTFVDGVKQEDREVRVIPCSVSSVPERNDFCPTPAQDEEYTRILGRINQFSEPFGVIFDEKGWYRKD